MEPLKYVGIFSIIPTSILLAVSFFILLALEKAEGELLKAFGRIIAVLLWFAAALIFSTAIYILFNPAEEYCPSQYGKFDTYQHEMINPHRGMMMDPHHRGMFQGQDAPRPPESGRRMRTLVQ